MNENFDWKRINFVFPEYYLGLGLGDKKDFDDSYPLEPNFSENGSISSRFKEKYGVQIFLNNEVPGWIKKLDGRKEFIEEGYKSNSKVVYEKVFDDLNNLYEIFEGWRSFVSNYSKGAGWKGKLQNFVQFYNYSRLVHMGDYYHFLPNNINYNFAPTDVLLKIRNTPVEGLNSEWEKYHLLSRNVSKGGKNKSNNIFGHNLVDCVKKSDEIYKLAPELEKIWKLF
ncbi:MAG: hypothetical protein NUV46_03770 [Nanoarchaeota archaeon]|nr:hypothetical protein [Nanoarchaeota archaeon]